jgi:hypothetical protein
MVTSCRARERGRRDGADDRRWRVVVVVLMAMPRSVGVGVRGAVWKSKAHHMAALKHSRLELWRLERPMSPRLKAMATHASIVEQAQGHHEELCRIPGTEHCNNGLTLCLPSNALRVACQPQQTCRCIQTKAQCRTHSLTMATTWFAACSHGSQHATQRSRNLTIFFSSH